MGGGWAGSCSFMRSMRRRRSGSGSVMRVRMISRPSVVGQMHVDHLHGGELRQRAAGGEAWSEAVETACQGDLQAVGEEGDEDVGFDAPLVVMKTGRITRSPLRVLNASSTATSWM